MAEVNANKVEPVLIVEGSVGWNGFGVNDRTLTAEEDTATAYDLQTRWTSEYSLGAGILTANNKPWQISFTRGAVG